ncbi:hypothetical protein JCM15519_11540 [Fundidesulfovibrio butyratiphilus]
MDTSADDKLAKALAARVLICTSWADDGDWRFLNILRDKGLRVELLEPALLRRRFMPGWVKKLSIRLCSFYQPLMLLSRRDRHDAILTLNTRIGTFYGLTARLIAPAKRPPHLLRDFHLDFTRFAHPLYQLRMLLVRLAVPGMDALLTTSSEECRLYSAIFGIESWRFRFYPDTAGGAYMAWDKTLPEGDYVFAYGNSDRDFDTLMRAAPNIKAPVVVLSQTYKPSGPLPPSARLITRRVPQEELITLIAKARAVVIPLKDYYVAAGQNAMLEVLALSRPLVVTRNVTVVEHARHEKDALIVPAKDPEAMAQAVNRLLDNPELGRTLGRHGRKTALACPERQADIFLETLGELLARRKAPANPKSASHG